MDQLFTEIRAAVAGNEWMLALFGVLAIPDICGALASQDGETTRVKYKEWFTENLGPQYPLLDADECYQMRCSMIHRSVSETGRYSRVMFVLPGAFTLHNCIANDALVLDLPTFSADMVSAAERWLVANRENALVTSNLEELVRWHENGVAPYVVGRPVLS